MTLALSITLNVNSTWVSTSFFLRLFKTYYLPYCNLVQGIYYIYHDWRLDNQWWHRPLKMATTVYEREISFAATQTGELSRRLTERKKKEQNGARKARVAVYIPQGIYDVWDVQKIRHKHAKNSTTTWIRAKATGTPTQGLVSTWRMRTAISPELFLISMG